METASYKPSAYYFRRRLRNATKPDELRAIGMAVVAEMERLKQWVRDQGMIPPKWTVDPDEAKEKKWKIST